MAILFSGRNSIPACIYQCLSGSTTAVFIFSEPFPERLFEKISFFDLYIADIAVYYEISWVTPLCNGSTTGFGPVSLGSNPDGVTTFFYFSADSIVPAGTLPDIIVLICSFIHFLILYQIKSNQAVFRCHIYFYNTLIEKRDEKKQKKFKFDLKIQKYRL